MTDTTEFDLNITLNQPLSHKRQAALYAFDDCKAYALPERRLLIRNPANGKSAVIMTEVLNALHLCREFRTLDEHIEAIEKGIPQLRGHAQEVRGVLETMIRDGMLMSASALCKAFNESSPKAEKTDEPAVVTIITCDRPEALERLLDSIAEHGDPAGFERLCVIDDSRQADSIERNEVIVQEFDRESAIETEYFGRARQRHLMARMIERAPEQEESIRFLIDFERWADEWTGGLARNYALLLSAGKRLVMLDDDALFQVYEPQPRPKGVIFRDEIRQASFFSEPGAWPGMKLRPELDPVKAHLYCLGLPLKDAMKRLGVGALLPEHLAGCSVAEVRRLRADMPVLVTQCGSLGDPGVGDNTWLIELAGESRDKMLESSESVKRAIANDNAWVGRKQPHFGARSNMSLITGLDNRYPLPPYFPIGKSEDRLFGIMVEMLYPAGAVLDYPWAAPHLPLDDRDRSESTTDFRVQSKFPEFFRDWIQVQVESHQGGNHSRRLELLGQLFAQLAGMDAEQLAELHLDRTMHMATTTLVEISDLLGQSAETPEPWREYLKNGLDRVNAELTGIVNESKPQAAGDDPANSEEVARWQGRWNSFADSLAAWNVISSSRLD